MLNFGKGMPWSEERDGVQKAFILGEESGMGDTAGRGRSINII